MKKNKKNIKIAAATGLTLFSLVTVFTATIAWFANVHNVYSSGMKIRVKQQGTMYTSLSVHRCKTNESTSTLLKFYETPETGNINLDYYSQLNMTQPVLLLFELTENGAPSDKVHLKVTSSSTAAYELISTSSSAPNYYGNFPFSSAVSFRVIPYTSSFSYDNVSISGVDLQSFVEITTETVDDQIVNTLSWKYTDSVIPLYDGTDPNVTLTYVAVIIDYNQEALSHIYSKNLGNTHDLVFDCDFTMWIS